MPATIVPSVVFENTIGPLIIKLAVVPADNTNLLPFDVVVPTTNGAAFAAGAPAAKKAPSLLTDVDEAKELFVNNIVLV